MRDILFILEKSLCDFSRFNSRKSRCDLSKLIQGNRVGISSGFIQYNRV